MTPMIVTVDPVQGGWCVACELCAGPLMFLSGARAEAQACRLAQAAAHLGRDATVHVRDRAGRVAGVFSWRGGGMTAPPRAPRPGPWPLIEALRPAAPADRPAPARKSETALLAAD